MTRVTPEPPRLCFPKFCGHSAEFMVEKRSEQRHRLLKTGTIKFGPTAITCMVRNMSNTGAALDVTSPDLIPEHFTLVFDSEGRHVPCHIVWRKEKRIGVAFD